MHHPPAMAPLATVTLATPQWSERIWKLMVLGGMLGRVFVIHAYWMLSGHDNEWCLIPAGGRYLIDFARNRHTNPASFTRP